MSKIETSPAEVALTMLLTKRILEVATSLNNSQIGTAALLMAAAISGQATRIPLEDYKALFDRTADEVYAEGLKKEALN